MATYYGPPTDPDVAAFYNTIVATGSSISRTSLGAVYNFVRDCKTAGIWNNLIMVAPFVGNDLNGALIKLKYNTSAGLVNTAFVGGDYVETGVSGGLNPGTANSTKHLTYGDTYNLNNCSMAAWTNQFRTSIDGYGAMIANNGGGGGPDRMWVCQPTSTTVWRLLCNVDHTDVPGVGTGIKGMFWASNNGGALSPCGTYSITGASVITFTSTTVATGQVGGIMFESPNGSYCTVPLQFAAVGNFMSSGDMATLGAAVLRMQNSLNRA